MSHTGQRQMSCLTHMQEQNVKGDIVVAYNCNSSLWLSDKNYTREQYLKHQTLSHYIFSVKGFLGSPLLPERISQLQKLAGSLKQSQEDTPASIPCTWESTAPEGHCPLHLCSTLYTDSDREALAGDSKPSSAKPGATGLGCTKRAVCRVQGGCFPLHICSTWGYFNPLFVSVV